MTVEWDGLAGAIHEAVVAAQRRWLELLSAEAEVGIRAGEFPHHLDPGQLAFELHGIAMSLNQAIQLFSDGTAPARARRALDGLLTAT